MGDCLLHTLLVGGVGEGRGDIENIVGRTTLVGCDDRLGDCPDSDSHPIAG